MPKHPVQISVREGRKRGWKIDSAVTLRAYEVYEAIGTPQPALVEGDCRGGFSAAELVCYLYARTFPRAEWRERFLSAIRSIDMT